MKMLNYKIIGLILCVLAIELTSCKPKQKIILSTTPVEEKENNELFRDIITKEFSYNTFSAKLNMNLTVGTRSFNSMANMRIVRDQALQISIQPLFGLEMFRLHLDPDSMTLLDRMNKRYVRESILSLKEVYPVGFDFYTLQSLFTNALFISGKDELETADYRNFEYFQASDLHYHLQSKDPVSGIAYSFAVNGEDRITFTHLMHPEKPYSLQWAYTHFSRLADQTFPYKMDIEGTTSSRKIEAKLTFSDIIINEPMQLSTSTPNSYTQVPLSEILKNFTSN